MKPEITVNIAGELRTFEYKRPLTKEQKAKGVLVVLELKK